jgi:Tfp pilus assembly protein PilX
MAKSANQRGNVLLCALCTILIVSAIGGAVLVNCTTRYNVVSSQVQSWKAALQAAEAGGDIAYAEVRKTILDPSNAFSGWSNSAGVYTSSVTTFGSNNLKASSAADVFYTDSSGSPWYRIRSKGVAPVLGLARTGMDDRMISGAQGDSLLRKIDFNYDHFIATYGPNGDGLGKALVAVAHPQLARRIELISAPVTPFEAAIKAGGTFYGLGSAAFVDSYRSSTGPYDSTVKDNPSDPRYGDSHSGTVEINTAVATILGTIYGNVYTNGGNVTKKTSNIYGIIDNNVPFDLPPFHMPNIAAWNYVASPSAVTSSTTITPPAAGSVASPSYYLINSFANNGSLTVNPVVNSGVTQETYVAIHVTSDIGNSTSSQPTITVPAHVHLQVYFDGNFQTKAQNIVNTSGYAGNLQFYAISPTDPNVQQTINLNSGGGSTAGFAAVFYAPAANFTINGGPDITGAIVCKNFYTNGNVHWHYDRALDNLGDAVDYRIASYVEDIR